jgi:hypothetical protein
LKIHHANSGTTDYTVEGHLKNLKMPALKLTTVDFSRSLVTMGGVRGAWEG